MNRPRRTEPPCPLSHTELDISIRDLTTEYCLRHHFRNEGAEPIEAVFTFPVPLDAAFLGLRATLAGETLEASVLPRHQASRAYDDAIADGDTAVLVTTPEPGVLCTSLGNLLPGESGTVELRLAAALRVADQTARFSLPLVHRPRFGHWALGDLETPNHDFAVEHPMSARIRVEGLLATAPVACNTHAARFEQRKEGLELTIGQAQLDRDLVLTFDLSKPLAPTARMVEDGDENLALVSFVLPMREDETPKELDLCLVLDGSGSMAGDAVAQSRAAMSAVLGALGESDRIQILRFGTTIVPLLTRPLPCTSRVRAALRAMLPGIDANLGGTEMRSALSEAIGQFAEGADPARRRAVILVTDGAVQSHDLIEIAPAANAAGIRIFVVAVGSNAGAEVLEPLAEQTGAVLERAVPAEPIDACVMRQFRRAREEGPLQIKVDWPGSGTHEIPMSRGYPGDAISLAAVLPIGTWGDVDVRIPSVGFALKLPLGSPVDDPATRALLGQCRYRASAPDAREAIALSYGLLTPETSAVLVKIRAADDKADGLPQIVKIPQMVPDGMVVASAAVGYLAAPAFLRRDCISVQALQVNDVSDIVASRAMRSRPERIVDAPEAEEPQEEFAADLAREIFEEIRIRLATHIPDLPNDLPCLQEIVATLPESFIHPATVLLERCKLSLSKPTHSARLLLALASTSAAAAVDAEDEMLLLLVAAGPTAWATRKDEGPSASVRTLARRIEALTSDETSPPGTSASPSRRKFLGLF